MSCRQVYARISYIRQRGLVKLVSGGLAGLAHKCRMGRSRIPFSSPSLRFREDCVGCMALRPLSSIVSALIPGPLGNSFGQMRSVLGDSVRTGMRTKRRETVETDGNRWHWVADRLSPHVQAARGLWPLLSPPVISCPTLGPNYGSEGWGSNPSERAKTACVRIGPRLPGE